MPYRGHTARLFKRDFAGEMLDRFSDLRLVDYGFRYHRDLATGRRPDLVFDGEEMSDLTERPAARQPGA